MSFLFYGNKPALSFLQNTLATGQIGHAYLFSGETGTGKNTLARQFAKGILCQDKTPPCEQCSSCNKMQRSCHPDYTEIGPEPGKESFPVDAVRALITNAHIRPNESSYRVFLLKRAETMLEEAANALLKLFEEPPAGVVLLLTCNHRANLLQTISSRCLSVDLFPVTDRECREALERSCPKADRSLLDEAALLGNGNIGRAIFYASDSTGQSVLSLSGKLEQALAQKNRLAFLQAVAPLEKNLPLFRAVLVALTERIRAALMQRFFSRASVLSALSQNYSIDAMIRMIRAIEDTEELISLHGNTRLTLCRLCVDLLE